MHRLREVRQREGAEILGPERAGPGIEQLDHLRSRGDLGAQEGADHLRQSAEQGMGPLGLFDQKPLGLGEAPRCAALDHVARESPGCTGESDQGHPPLQLATRQSNGVEHVPELVFRHHVSESGELLHLA